MPQSLRVLLLSWRDAGHPEGGGAESFLERVAVGLREYGYPVTVRCAHYAGAVADEVVHGVRFVRRGGRFTVYPRAVAALVRHRKDYDVVIDVQNGLPFWAPLVTRVPVLNVTHHVHREQWPMVFGRLLGRVGWWLESRVAPRVYRRCRYVTVSQSTRDDLVSVGVEADRIRVVYSGIDPPARPPAADAWPRSATPNLVVLGRLVPHKRVELAIRTVADLRPEHPDLTLTVIGQGYWEDSLRHYAESLGVAGAVRFAGFVDNVTKHQLLAAAWVHLLPSVKEGWGLAVVESAAHGTPTVAFRSAGGTAESIRDGVTGVLVDDAGGSIAAVRRLLSDHRLRDGLGAAARVHAAKFTWQAVVDVVAAELCAATGLPVPAPEPVVLLPTPRQPQSQPTVAVGDQRRSAGVVGDQGLLHRRG